MKKFLLFLLLVFWFISSYSQPIQLEWQACFGTTMKEEAIDVCATGDGYIVVGRYETSDDIDVLLIRTDLFGNLVWQKTIGGSMADVPFEYSRQVMIVIIFQQLPLQVMEIYHIIPTRIAVLINGYLK